MEADAPKARILIVVSSMDIGGPQKSLIGLLQRLDFTRLSVEILVLTGEVGPLSRWLPGQVRVLATPPEVRAATLPRSGIGKSICILLRLAELKKTPVLIWRLIQGAVTRGGKQQSRQQVWRIVRGVLPRLSGRYDAAFGILGLSTYAVVDLVDARYKYHWIRSDTRILQRNESIDGSYYLKLTGAIAVSQMCANIFCEMYPSISGKVVVYKNDIPRSVESVDRPFDGVPNEITLLTVSRLDPLKGIDLAIDACKELVDRGHHLRWLVLGDGSERSLLESLVASRGLDGVFLMVGSVLDTSRYLEAATIYVHPSRTEGRSNSVEEARAVGKPIVATAYETVSDQIDDGVTGLICGMSPTDVAATVERLICNPELARELGDQARQSYETEVNDPTAMFLSLADGRLSHLLRS